MDDFGSKLEKDVLFTLDRIRSYERNKAVDDFVKKINERCYGFKASQGNLVRVYVFNDSIIQIAEQLKAGVLNE